LNASEGISHPRVRVAVVSIEMIVVPTFMVSEFECNGLMNSGPLLDIANLCYKFRWDAQEDKGTNPWKDKISR
jgi:hypothetical protein